MFAKNGGKAASLLSLAQMFHREAAIGWIY